MLSFILVLVLGILIGILVGLLPALPVFTGPFLLYYFYNNMPVEHLLVFWLAVVSGSQFFGSVATITTGIPGEESSLVYINDLNNLTVAEKNSLLYSTALGSLVAGVLSTGFLWLCVQYVNVADLPWLNGLTFQIIVYTMAIVGFMCVDRHYFWTMVLILLGLFIGPKQNYALPNFWYNVQDLIQGYTFYMLALGTIVIPDIVMSAHKKLDHTEHYVAAKTKVFSILQGFKASALGMLSGIIPGPSASLSSIVAYRTAGPNVSNKIIAAETANNSAVITCAIPLMVLLLPINQNALIMSNILDLKGITISEAILAPSFISGVSVINLVAASLLGCLFVFYLLSTHLIDFYSKLIMLLHYKMKYILIAMVTLLIVIDVYSNEINVGTYLTLLSIFTALGFVLKKYNISPLPFLFAAILGDKLIWLYIQFFKIYF